ncbi:MAG: hypothetical protein CMP51_06635 [Flavobacteriales bacterium]|nr:hypothetical protein [Flavobacteriales bacterium]
MFRYISYILIVFLFCFSCGTSTIMVNVQRPADITVPLHIKNVVIANRSTPNKENLAENIVEGILTGEVVGSDKKGSKYCINGLVNALSNSERFALKNQGEIMLKGTGTSQFPDLLSWRKVQKICDQYDADALIVLSTFDSDSREFEGKSVVRNRTIKGAKVREIKYPVTLAMEIQSGWRIYDASKRKIIDVNTFTELKESKIWGSSYNDARSKLPSKRQALKSAGIFAGEKYAYRITPLWVRVSRTYFSGPEDKLKLAKKYVSRQDWDEAIKLWKSLVDNNDPKIARKANYNLALASEINGTLSTAIEYALRSENLGEKRASLYIRILKKRQKDQERLKEQIIN